MRKKKYVGGLPSLFFLPGTNTVQASIVCKKRKRREEEEEEEEEAGGRRKRRGRRRHTHNHTHIYTLTLASIVLDNHSLFSKKMDKKRKGKGGRVSRRRDSDGGGRRRVMLGVTE